MNKLKKPPYATSQSFSYELQAERIVEKLTAEELVILAQRLAPLLCVSIYSGALSGYIIAPVQTDYGNINALLSKEKNNGSK